MSKWDELSMAEKAEMMKVAVRQGITNLSDIKQKYNEFAEGGDTKKNLYPIGGLIPGINLPTVIKGATNEVRQRLYDNVTPFGYNNPVERIASAVFLNKPSDKQEYNGNRDILDDLWGTYLGIPKDRRHYDPVLKTSKYKPTNSKDSNQDYVSVPFANDDIDHIIKEALWQGERSQLLNPELGTFTIDTGRDKKGQYVSYYDKWDLNPFRGITNVGNKVTKFLGLNKAGDLSFGIGKPIEIYDRIYLDDYYGIPKEHRGGSFLPEVVVKGRKKAEGGEIHIKPENRGKFTALKERTGHSATWFKEHGTPAQKKMAVFALNSRKWKHGLGGNLFLTGGPEGEGRKEVTNLNTWDEFAAQSPFLYTIGKALDPTGISGYGDAREAINQYDSSPSLSNGYTAVMETLGALPIVSKAGKAIKFLQGAITGQGIFDDYNYAQEKKKEYGDELVVDYWDNTVKPRREAERHGEQMKSKMAYTDVHHVPSFKLAPKGSKSGQVISDYDINHRVVKKYKKAISQ